MLPNAQITMEMFFRDMRRATLDLTRRQLRFKIDHALCHYGGDYSHEDPSHFVVILFSSDLDAARVSQEVYITLVCKINLLVSRYLDVNNLFNLPPEGWVQVLILCRGLNKDGQFLQPSPGSDEMMRCTLSSNGTSSSLASSGCGEDKKYTGGGNV